MPRYFFHIMDGRSAPDLTGTELSDIYATRAAAVRASGEMLREIGSRFWNDAEWSMEVQDEAGHRMFTLRFSAEEHAT